MSFMKTSLIKGCLLLGIGCWLTSASAELRQVDGQATVSVTTPHLPYGVADVVKLTRAQVSDDIIVSYLQNASTVYSLEPKDIVYLKEQGVSDRVLSAMMEQRQRVAATASVQTSQTPNYQ